MSHINEALKKAQEEKDSLYKRYKKLISGSADTGKSKKITRKTIIILLSTLMALAVISSVVFYALRSGDKKTASHRQVIHKEIAKPDQVNLPPSSKTAGPTVQAPLRSTTKAKTAFSPSSQTEEKTSKSASTQEESIKRSEKAASVTSRQKPIGTPLEAITPNRQRIIARPVETATEPLKKSKEDQIKNLYHQSLLYHRNNNLIQAKNLYHQILKIDPNNVTALNNLGVIYMTQKKDSQAVHVFTKAIIIKDDYVDPYYNLSCLYSTAGDIQKSAHYLKKAITLKNDVKIWAKNDKDLERLRQSEAYKKLVKDDTNSEKEKYDIYIVKKDEWIFDIIRKRYGATDKDIHTILEMIKQMNPALMNSNIIYPGQKLLLPKEIESDNT